MSIPDTIALAAAERLREHRRAEVNPFGLEARPRPHERRLETNDEGRADNADEEPTSWEFVELADTLSALRAGTVERPTPTVGKVSDGSALYYEGRINGLFGPSGEGKSMLAHAITVQEITAGRDVLWIDFEDDEVGTLTRLIDLGADDDGILAHFHYERPELPTNYRVFNLLEERLAELDCRFAVIDSLGEFMAMEGVEDKDGPVAQLMRRLPRFLADRGPAVLPIDHVTKSREKGPKEFAIGSQRKRAAVSGAAYEVIQYKPMAKGAVGAVKLVVAKDRPGYRKKGSTAAEVTVDSTADDGTIAVSFDPSERPTNEAGDFRPTVLMARASDWLQRNPGEHSKRTVLAEVTGKRETVAVALDRLVDEGFAQVRAEGQSLLYRGVEKFIDA